MDPYDFVAVVACSYSGDSEDEVDGLKRMIVLLLERSRSSF